ncbi:hypothetical protein NC651_031883 [Populus alba x Populus x berolinensis]|nr:hypothetical protein NC651_031883 [Populus alba x Populus x berolinensis]
MNKRNLFFSSNIYHPIRNHVNDYPVWKVIGDELLQGVLQEIICNLQMLYCSVQSKNELYSAEQDILLQSVRIMKEHGARLGITTTSQ